MKETTIKITRKFKDWLCGKSKKGETYEDIIKRLIKFGGNGKWKPNKNKKNKNT
jgi:hypothetical protein